MLIQLLEILKNGKSCTLQELAELTNNDIENIKMEIEYLENNGYIKKKTINQCKNNCFKCNNCIVDDNNNNVWVLLKDS